MTDLVLHDDVLDENCYRVRLFLSLLGRQARMVAVNVVPGGAQDSPAFRAISPAGVLPVLRIAGVEVCGAGAALLALAHGTQTWLPRDPGGFAEVAHWLEFAGGPLAAATRARRIFLFGEPGDRDGLRRQGAAALRIMEDHLALRWLDGSPWFVGDGPTVADVALFPAFALSRDWEVGHEAFPALRRWMRRMLALPGFVTMPGIPDLGVV
ncbi:glutathione S-transferase family protein [Gluconacetobacter azotocaptans]|uniref:Glutathione S-transferase family protein n=1 Tax=Gluconacetobacter azotocaptans TaxID=142834 RepID=A0A7W4PEI5_9PROT|nr:glutathione binding-like protein [Gluconacetobacter azotocaptans]MBB2190590.1 glutathione S-transferase family protein [Gluconacetobacter azotocaptans]GBQ26791.1 glutathione S-transferase [Gluconacetobacter azotocaptans DSM 13594]